MADTRPEPHHGDGGHNVPAWLLVVYAGITVFFLYYIINFAILHPVHPQYGF